MLRQHTSTRVLFLGLSVFAAITVYVLIITYHVKLPQPDHSHRIGPRDKLAMEHLHHVLLEDFARYDIDQDAKLSIHEFATMLRDSKARVDAVIAEDQSEAGSKDTAAQPSRISLDNAGNLDEGKGYDYAIPYDEIKEEEMDSKTGAAGEDGTGIDIDYGLGKGAGTRTNTTEVAVGKTTVGTTVPSPPSPSGSLTVVAAADTSKTTPNSRSGDGCPHLSREHVAQFARNGTVMLTVADWRIFGTMGINWMKHLAKWGVDYYLVGATDAKTAQFLGHTGKHPCFKFYEDGPKSGSDEYRYGDAHYNTATWRKVVVVARMVHWGFNVIHSDVDVVWFRDPLPYFLGPALADVDMAVSSDLISNHNPVGDEGLDVDAYQHVNFNTGVYFVKSTAGGKAFMAGWAGSRSRMGHENDQVGVYAFIRKRPAQKEGRAMVLQPKEGEREAAAAIADKPEAFESVKKTDPLPVGSEMRLGALGVHMLLNGYSYFIPRLHEFKKVSPLGVHMTWVPLSKEGKFHRFRDGMLYDDPPEYYDAPGLKFLTADVEAPDAPEGFNDWKETEDMIQVHLKNMPPQLKQMYRAVAVAAILRRTLIFPRLRCFCFKNWFMSEQCRIPGDKVTQFPLDCALDQVFRPKVLYNYPPLDTKDGPLNFTFREYSLLDNPRTPDAVKNGQVLVIPEGTSAGNTTGFVRVVTIKPNLTQDALVKALESVKDAKVLRLRHPLKLLSGFDDKVLEASVASFANSVTANWCCRDEPYIAKGMERKVKMVMAW